MGRGAALLVVAGVGLTGCGAHKPRELPATPEAAVLKAQVDVAGGCLGELGAPRAVDTLIRIYRRWGADRTVNVPGDPPASMARELVDAANILQPCQPDLAVEIDRVLKNG